MSTVTFNLTDPWDETHILELEFTKSGIYLFVEEVDTKRYVRYVGKSSLHGLQDRMNKYVRKQGGGTNELLANIMKIESAKIAFEKAPEIPNELVEKLANSEYPESDRHFSLWFHYALDIEHALIMAFSEGDKAKLWNRNMFSGNHKISCKLPSTDWVVDEKPGNDKKKHLQQTSKT